MNALPVETENLLLLPRTREEVRAWVESLDLSVRAQLSPDWLRLLNDNTAEGEWIYGYTVVLRDGQTVVGACGFKAPPSEAGMVEIAYGIDVEFRGRGYATEAAAALTTRAFRDNRVRIVIAHTLPDNQASQRVLTRCGYQHVGEVMDPEDGLVWRWEKRRDEP